MQKKRASLKKILAISSATLCVAAIPSICFMLSILNSDLPNNPNEDLHNNREFVRYMNQTYLNTYDTTVKKTRNSPEYKAAQKKLTLLESKGFNATNSQEYKLTEDRLHFLMDSSLNQNRKLVEISEAISKAYSNIEILEGDSARRDSIRQLPIDQRFKKNWLQFMLDVNQSRQEEYAKRVKVLENKLQNYK